jgi:hypothetical protein
MQHLSPVRHRDSKVLVEEPDCADPYSYQQEGLEQLKDPDEDENE